MQIKFRIGPTEFSCSSRKKPILFHKKVGEQQRLNIVNMTHAVWHFEEGRRQGKLIQDGRVE